MNVAEQKARLIEDLYDVYQKGKADGMLQGGNDWYDTFWNAFQNGGANEQDCQRDENNAPIGSRKNYQQAFAREGWDEASFKPKYSMKPENCSQMFWNNLSITDLEKALQTAGVTLDTSETTNFLQFVQSSSITVVPKIDMRKSTNSNFALSSDKLITVRELMVSESTPFSDTFKASINLEEITISGTIGQNGFDISKSGKVSKASIESIIGHLSDTTSGLTITLPLQSIQQNFEGGYHGQEFTELKNTKPNWGIAYG